MFQTLPAEAAHASPEKITLNFQPCRVGTSLCAHATPPSSLPHQYPLPITNHPTPIPRIDTSRHIAMKCRIPPIRRMVAQAMFYRVVVQIIHVTVKVILITDVMLPETPLPKRRFPMPAFRFRQPFGSFIFRGAGNAHPPFDHIPPRGVIRIAGRQRPQTMQMIGQQYPGIDRKRPFFTHPANGIAQRMANRLFT